MGKLSGKSAIDRQEQESDRSASGNHRVGQRTVNVAFSTHA